jgi:chaperonin cofactor prefoldin
MGGGSSRAPEPIDPCPGKTRAIRDLNDRINDLNNRIWNLSNAYQSISGQFAISQQNLSASQASDEQHTRERDNYNRLYTNDETVTIPALTTERDLLIAIRDRLMVELGQSATSNQMANELGTALTNANQLSSDANVALDLDNLHTKEKLYAGIRLQNETLRNKYNEIQNHFTTDDQKSFYQQQQVDFMNSLNNWLSLVYILLFVILALLLFVTKNEKNLYFYKLPVLILFLIAPFLLPFFIDNGISVLRYIHAFVNVNAYTNEY